MKDSINFLRGFATVSKNRYNLLRQNIYDWVLAFQFKEEIGKNDSKDEKGSGMWFMLI